MPRIPRARLLAPASGRPGLRRICTGNVHAPGMYASSVRRASRILPAHSRTSSTSSTDSGARAFAMAGLKPKDVDVAELYDAFTPMVIIQLEDLGFCGSGEGGPFVQGGRIEVGGELPVCTHGGLLSHCHPGFPGSTFNIVEAVRQLRDECGARQVRNAEIALVQGQGGPSSSHCTLILGKER